MQDKDNTKTTFIQLFDPIFKSYLFNQIKDRYNVDKYVKKLNLKCFLQLMACAQIRQFRGLSSISDSLKEDAFAAQVGIESISASQLSRRLRELPPILFRELFNILKVETIKHLGPSATQQIGNLYLIDSSTISLCLSRYSWASFRKTKAGVKLHLRLKFLEEGLVIPDEAIITPAKPADRTQMDNLVVIDKDALNVFDRGYLDYRKFDAYCEQGIRFVTRSKSNTLVEVVSSVSGTTESPITSDSIVYLGKTGQSKMKHPMRRITSQDTEGNPVVIITNDFELSTQEISDIYRYRWHVELFFKWIKQHLKVKHFHGLSPNAVENQLLIALITYCLMLLLTGQNRYKGSLFQLSRLLTICLLEPYEQFKKKLLATKVKLTKHKRRRRNEQLIFEQTLSQLINQEADYLYEIGYDPLVD
jgi:hypothetical protein